MITSYEDWKDAVTSQKSIVPVRCKQCLFEAEPQLTSFHLKLSTGCFCTKKPQWRSRHMHRLFVEREQQSKFHVVGDTTSFDWWINNNMRWDSIVSTVCNSCGFHANVNAKRFMDADPSCWCSPKSAPWSGTQGFAKFRQILSDTKYDTTDWASNEQSWVERRPGAHSSIPIVCSKCTAVCNTSITNMVRQLTAQCWCSGNKPYSGEDGRIRLVALLEESDLLPISSVIMDSDEWMKSAMSAESSIEVACSKCNYTCITQIRNIARSNGIGCACRWKTQRLVYEWAVSKFNGVEVRREYQPIGKKFRFDIMIGENHAIEVDGIQHFQPGPFGSDDDKFLRTLQSDLEKENYVEETRSLFLLRLYQQDVWLGRIDWRSCIESFVSNAPTKKVTFQPFQPLYTTGEFASLRARKG